VVSRVYGNAKTENFWMIGYRIFDPEADDSSKLDQVEQMLTSAEYRRRGPFLTVPMNSW
jgi:hypothetical protein